MRSKRRKAEKPGNTAVVHRWKGSLLQDQRCNTQRGRVSRSRPYRRRLSQPNLRWKTRGEIYQVYKLLHIPSRETSSNFRRNGFIFCTSSRDFRWFRWLESLDSESIISSELYLHEIILSENYRIFSKKAERVCNFSRFLERLQKKKDFIFIIPNTLWLIKELSTW